MRKPNRLRDALALAALALALAAPAARAAFEDIEESPAARALGGAWAALAGDAFAPLHNPSALAWAGRVSVAASYLEPFGLPFASQSAFAAAGALPGRLGGAGVGVRAFGVDYLGEDLEHETTVSLAHGFHLLQDRQSELAAGWAVDFYSLGFGRSVTGLDPGDARAAGVRVGATAVVRERTRVGFTATNLNNPSIGDRDREDLRRRITTGLSYAPYSGVETALAMTQELGEAVQYRGGTAVALSDAVVLRLGVRSEPNTFDAGVGLRWKGLALDYAFSTGGGVLGETHHVGVGWTPRPQP